MTKKVKQILISYSKKNPLFKKMLRNTLFILGRIKYLLYFLINKTDEKLIIFESFMGGQYSDSPKYIYLEMLKNKKYKDYIFVWAFINPLDYKYLLNNKNTIIIKYKSEKYYQAYSKAKYWFTNSRLNESIIKKENQVYIQCWHGTPLKRLGFDIKVEGGNSMNSVNEIRKKYKGDAKRYNYMISPSKYCTQKFISAFNLENNKIILETGYPRNDFLINYKNSDVKNVRKKLNIPNNKKIILYAPTWRDNQHKSGLGYTYKTEVDFDYLKEKIGKDYIVLFRAHYFIANSFDFDKYNGFIYDVSKYDDINDLYIISDILITDYSSAFFDYTNLKRSMIFYMYDFEEYKNKLRDFYFDLDELPGPIVYNEKDLVNEINNIEKSNKKYIKTYEKFNEKYNYLDDGQASKRVIEKIIGENT
ncbi:MAG: CDP-glycerol glycerophosphotransferase family protein [Bacilli bacterium]|nr:CDP-glycerol glycerophosphotransferase family protein [Bacilli bacterium]MDD4406973.1 CDP-glycerol glycerophosphotransferase family protein [Bacilli bacterium]